MNEQERKQLEDQLEESRKIEYERQQEKLARAREPQEQAAPDQPGEGTQQRNRQTPV